MTSFDSVHVKLVDNSHFHGIEISYSGDCGFGSVWLGWGLEPVKEKYPHQYGFYTDNENMDKQFVQDLIEAAAPYLADLSLAHDIIGRAGNKPHVQESSEDVPLPCPFCGSPARIGGDDITKWVFCGDESCDAVGPEDTNTSCAIAKWNKPPRYSI